MDRASSVREAARSLLAWSGGDDQIFSFTLPKTSMAIAMDGWMG